MGAETSKTAAEQPGHVFLADQPVRFSSELSNSIQNSPDNDSTRAKHLDLIVQSRVTAELERLREAGSQRFSEIADKLSTQSESSSTESQGDESSSDAAASAASAALQRQQDLSRETISKEIAHLKQKLEARRTLEKLDPEVEKSRSAVVACLRKNENRPLDCWQQVEEFKERVADLERRFLTRSAK